MKELETNQIIQAFEHMVKNADNHIPITGKMLLEDVFEVLKRQQAEIKKQRSTIKNFQATKEMLLVDMKRLKKHNKEYGFCNMLGNCLVYSKNLKDYNDMRKGLKSEAIKKFAERLHKLLKFYYPEQKFVHTHIDNLLKEMTE